MNLSDIDDPSMALLDEATEGLFSSLRARCNAHGWEAHLTVQTSLEGLPDDTMKLFVVVTAGDQTKDFSVGVIKGSLKTLGWNIYLHDRLNSARFHLNRATAKSLEPTAVMARGSKSLH